MGNAPVSFVCPKGCEVPQGSETPKFCPKCGSNLMTACPSGHLTPAGGRYCRECGVVMDIDATETHPRVVHPVTEAASTTTTPLVSGKPAAAATTAAAAPGVPPPAGVPDKRKRGGPWLVVAIVAVVVVLGLAGGLIFVLASGHPSHSNASASSAGTQRAQRTPIVTTTTITITTTTVPVEQQAAEALAGLLAQSVADRSAINAASDDVAACGNLSQDEQTFNNAATSRQNLISSLASLSNASALSASMIQSLNAAWQASEEVDQDYANWAADEESNGCTPNDTSDENYQAAEGPNQTATQNKTAFATAWDPIATTYNLPTYQWNQL